MKKNIWVFGTIAGLICTAWIIIGIGDGSSHFENGELYGYTAMIIAFSMIFVGIKNYRDKYNNGHIAFGKAFKIGLWITLIASTFYVVVWAIDYNFFAQDFMDKYADFLIERAKAKGMSQAQIDAKITELNGYKDMYKNPLFFTLLTYSEIFPVGLLLSLVSALILRKKPGAGAQEA